MACISVAAVMAVVVSVPSINSSVSAFEYNQAITFEEGNTIDISRLSRANLKSFSFDDVTNVVEDRFSDIKTNVNTSLDQADNAIYEQRAQFASDFYARVLAANWAKEEASLYDEDSSAAEVQRMLEEARIQYEVKERAKLALINVNMHVVGDGSTTDINQMLWPLPGHNWISTYFGYREQPMPGATTNHRGIDIVAPLGTEIVASLAGTVVRSGYHSEMGLHVIIDHGNGVKTVYMHCSALLVNAGDQVKQGQIIGLVGTTGCSTGYHLHYGVSINDTYVNPLDYIMKGVDEIKYYSSTDVYEEPGLDEVLDTNTDTVVNKDTVVDNDTEVNNEADVNNEAEVTDVNDNPEVNTDTDVTEVVDETEVTEEPEETDEIVENEIEEQNVEIEE